MADEAKLQLESALNTLLSITEKSSNLSKDLKKDMADSVSTLRNIFVNLENSAGEHKAKINQLHMEESEGGASGKQSRQRICG